MKTKESLFNEMEDETTSEKTNISEASHVDSNNSMKQIFQQKKNLLEIAGQQITGFHCSDRDATIPNTEANISNLIQADICQITELSLDYKSVMQIIENLCSKLTKSGEDYIMVMTNPYKQNSDYIASKQGREFIKQNANIVQGFVQHCYNAVYSSSTPDQVQSNKEKHQFKSSANKFSEDTKEAAEFKQNESSLIKLSENSYRNEEFDSDETENYEIEKIVLKAVEVIKQNYKNENAQQSFQKGKTVTKIKEYPTPTNIKVIEHFDDQKMQLASPKHVSLQNSLHLKNKSRQKSKCENCGKSFQSKSVLNNHLMKMHKEKICSLRLLDQSVNRKKAKKQDGNQGTGRCKVCGKNMGSVFSLKKHMSVHKQQIRYQCEHCSKIFWRSESYKSHVIFHEKPKHACSICDKTFYLKRSLKKHKELHRRECRACHAVFKDKENYELHICEQDDPENFTRTYESWVTEDGKHVCGICEKVFPKRRGLLTHRKLHSTVYTSCNVCFICNKSYRTRNSLRKHIKVVHTDTRDFICDLCGKCFKQQDTLNAHMRTHSSNRTEYQCKECGKYLSARAALKVHLRMHQEIKPFICDVCGTSFSQRGNLAKHMLSHTTKTRYTCEKCGKEYKYHETWKTHMRSHAIKAGLADNEVLAYGKFYECEVCKKKVASASQYKVHMRTHTNERPYPCTHCGKCFKESGKLSRHMRIHRPSEHNEHNYTEKSKSLNLKKDDQMVMAISVKQNFEPSQVAVQRNGNMSIMENLMASNSNQSAEVNHQNVHFIENMSFSEETCSDTDLVIIKDGLPSVTDGQIRVIDDNRHQFLMHQLAPVTNLIMESPDGHHIQVPTSAPQGEMHIMQVGFVDESHVNNANHICPSGYTIANTDCNQGNNMLAYNKYFQA